MNNWSNNPEYSSKYNDATYLATKELRKVYEKEYKDILDRHLLEKGIVSKRMKKKLIDNARGVSVGTV